MARFVFSFSWRTLRFAPRLVNRTLRVRICTRRVHIICAPSVHIYTRMRGALLHSHDFDTITCVRRCERAVMFFVTSLRFGRGACVRACDFAAHSPHRACARACVRTLRHARLCAHVCTLSGTHMCERVHVSAPCGCVISFRSALSASLRGS